MVAVADGSDRLDGPQSPRPTVVKFLGSIAVMSRPQTTVAKVVIAAMTVAPPRGVAARSMARSSQRSTRVSSPTCAEFASAAASPTCGLTAVQMPRLRYELGGPKACADVL